MSDVTENNTMDDNYMDMEELTSLEIAEQDVAPMFGSLLSFAGVKTETKKLLTKKWWNIISTWYPKMLTEIYCVPPVHFYAVTYKPKEDKPNLQEPYERFGMRLYLPMQQTNVVDDEAQQRVLATLLAFAKKKGLVCFVLSNVEFQNYLNKSYETAQGDDVKPPRGIPPTNEEGEVDVIVIDKNHGVFLLNVKGTGYRRTDDMSEQDKLKSCVSPIMKVSRQLPKNAEVLRRILSDLDPHQMIKIRTGVLMPNLDRGILRNTLEMFAVISEEFMNAIGAHSQEQLLDCCLCSDGFPPANASLLECHTFERINYFWSTLEKVTGEMEQAMPNETYQQLVARFCGHLSTVKIYTEKSMPRVRLETIPPRKKGRKRRFKKAKPSKINVIPFECRTIAGAVREVARRFSELVLLPEQIDLLQQREDFVHLEGPPGTGKTLMLLLKVLIWLDSNNMVWMLSLAPPSRSIIHVLYEQVKQMLYEHKGREAAEAIIKKRLRIFIMTRPEKTLDNKYFERKLHKWRLCAKLNDCKINSAYSPVAPQSDTKFCLMLDETGVSGKGLRAFFNQVFVCQRNGCFESGEAGFTAGLSVWSASVEKCGRPCYARDPQERKTEDKFGIYRQLRMPLRCPPSIQRALMLVQPDLDHSNVFVFQKDYVLPNLPDSARPDSEFRHQYHADGLPVYLIAHGGHKKANEPIWLCRECGEDLAIFLKDTLRIGEEEPFVSDVPLCYKDVLIVGNHGAFNESVYRGGFFLSLYQKGLRVAICCTGEEGVSALPPEDVILVTDITTTHGLERAVVVVVPEHPGSAQSTQISADTWTTSDMCADDLEMDGGEDESHQKGKRASCQDRTYASCLKRARTSYEERPFSIHQEMTLISCQDMSPEGISRDNNRSVHVIQTVGSDEQMVVTPRGDMDCLDKYTRPNVTLRQGAAILKEDTVSFSRSADVDTQLGDLSLKDGATGGTCVELFAPDGAGERVIEDALRTLTPAARRDLFFIGSRATCQLIIFHFG